MAKKKNKSPRVRGAKPGDRNLFRKLWLEYLTESYETKDSEFKPDDFNMERYSKLFDLYVSEMFPGVVLFIGDSAVLMWGGMAEDPFHTDNRRAFGFGTYVRPSARRKGYSKIIRKEGAKRLKVLGFDAVVGEIKHGGSDFDARVKAAEASGMVQYATIWTMNLKGE
jgi:hypothetical protein